MKEITKKEMEELTKQKYLVNTSKGVVNKYGYKVGFYRTRNKRYIEDKYVDIARKLLATS